MQVELKDAAERGTNYRLSGWTRRFVGFEGVAPSVGRSRYLAVVETRTFFRRMN